MSPPEAVVAPPEAPAHQRVTVAGLLLAAAAFGTGFAQPTLVENFTFTDVAIGAVAGVMLVHALAGATRVAGAARSLALPAALILAGTLLGATHVGLTRWIVGDLIRDVGIAVGFLGVLDVARREGLPALRVAGLALVASALAVSFHLIVIDTGLRAMASFPNPNVAGHFLATVVIGLHALAVPRGVRRITTVVLLLAIARTSSFGAVLQVLVGVAVLSTARLRHATRHRPHLFPLLVGAVVAVAVALVVWAPQLLPEDTDGTGLASSRLERSADGRFELWGRGFELLGEHPLGIGAGSTNGLHLLDGEKELHNEPLAYLVERGPLGFVGFLVLAAALWRLAPPGGVSRALLAGFALSSLVRETSHYRHLWIVLALVLVSERLTPREAASAA